MKKFQNRGLLALLASLAIAGLAVYLLLTNVVFRVREVRVEGNATIAAEDIIRAARLPLGGKMSAVDAVRAKLELERGGLVELVEIQKHYPSNLLLVVRERSRDAVVAHAGFVLVLEADGTVVESLREMPDTNAVYVSGLSISYYRPGEVVGAPADQLAALSSVLVALEDGGARSYVSELNVADSNSIYIYSRTGMRVDLGNAENMERKIIWMAGALADLESRGETGGNLDVSSGSKADYRPA